MIVLLVFEARMVGFQEVPAIFSAHGQGTLRLDLDRKARTITFKETFSGLSAPALTTIFRPFVATAANSGVNCRRNRS